MAWLADREKAWGQLRCRDWDLDEVEEGSDAMRRALSEGYRVLG